MLPWLRKMEILGFLRLSVLEMNGQSETLKRHVKMNNLSKGAILLAILIFAMATN